MFLFRLEYWIWSWISKNILWRPLHDIFLNQVFIRFSRTHFGEKYPHVFIVFISKGMFNIFRKLFSRRIITLTIFKICVHGCWPLMISLISAIASFSFTIISWLSELLGYDYTLIQCFYFYTWRWLQIIFVLNDVQLRRTRRWVMHLNLTLVFFKYCRYRYLQFPVDILSFHSALKTAIILHIVRLSSVWNIL